MYGCNKAGGGGAVLRDAAHVGATCGNLAMSGTASFDWVERPHSTAFLLFHPQALEPNKVFVNGSMTSGHVPGPHRERVAPVHAGLRRQRPQLQPDSNLLQKIAFTNSQSFQLLTPTVTTTTQSVGPTTTQAPSTTSPVTPTTAPPTVPVTNQGSTSEPSTTAVRVTLALQGGPGGGGGGGGGGARRATQSFPQGTLAFTGNSGLAAMFGFEALLVGGALACLDPERRRRRVRPLRVCPAPAEVVPAGDAAADALAPQVDDSPRTRRARTRAA